MRIKLPGQFGCIRWQIAPGAKFNTGIASLSGLGQDFLPWRQPGISGIVDAPATGRISNVKGHDICLCSENCWQYQMKISSQTTMKVSFFDRDRV